MIASVDTNLPWAQAVNRLDIGEQQLGLPELMGDMVESGTRKKTAVS